MTIIKINDAQLEETIEQKNIIMKSELEQMKFNFQNRIKDIDEKLALFDQVSTT